VGVATGEPISRQIIASPELDGVVFSDGTFDTTGATLFVGDDDASADGVGARQFYSFDLSRLPSNAQILNADVSFSQIEQVGTPYDSLGSLRIEHVDYGPSLEGADYDTPVLEDLGGLIVADPDLMVSGRALPVGDLVAAALGSSSRRLQFRLRFENLDSDSDGTADHAVFVDSELTNPYAAPYARPTLTVVYRGSGGEPEPTLPTPPRLPPPEPIGLTVFSTREMDGVVRSDGTVDTTSPGLTGDLDGVTNGLGVRQFFSFDLSAVPPGSKITAAQVSLQQTGGNGIPYHTHGYLAFDHVDYGESLDGTDFDVPVQAELAGFSNISNPGTAQPSGRTFDVKAALRADVDAGKKTFQVRLRFKNMDSDANGVSDHAFWCDMDAWIQSAGAASPPQIVIWYLPPP
jgi:hypothetical protein